ncbi:MAG: response regulator [Deltaproteobacteria bacterium]|nr:response regulator [Deltaproteobacteria bacterium]
MFHILLVEDNLGDQRLTFEALKDGRVEKQLHVVQDGVEAMSFLRREDKYAVMPRPDLVILDLNLPRRDGREVLKEMKKDASLAHIPVVVLTTSNAEEDIVKSYDLHANCYITKPVDLDDFFHAVQWIEQFWLTLVQLPPRAV